MTTGDTIEISNPTLSFETFWNWLVTHPNCILRAGTSEAVIYDDEDLHWHFATEGSDVMVIQVIRGKRLMGEMFLRHEQVSYVQGYEGDMEDEHVFELISESETERVACYFFVLAHGYEDEDSMASGRAVH